MRTPFQPSLLLSSVALAAAQALAQTPPAQPPAQPASTDGGEGLTITVVARRVEERVIDVPLTIKALTARDLQERSITSVTDLALFNPGLSYSPDFGRVSERPVVRGISALRPEAPQPVSVFIDGLFMRDGTLGLALDDAQRVEVIKGPQSALYGRATYAGAINYITEKPGNELRGRFALTHAQAGERTLSGALTVPLIKDKLSARVRLRSYEFGGQYTNSLSGNKLGTESTNSAGMIVNFTPSDSFQALLTVDRSDDRDGIFNATVRSVPTQSPPGTVTSQNNTTNIANGAMCNGRTLNIVGDNPVTRLPDATVAPAATTRANGWPCGPSTFSGTYVSRNEADLANYTDPSTGINYGNIGGLDRQMSRTGLTLNYEFGGGYTLTSQTGLTRLHTHIGADQSYNGTRFAITGASWTSYDRDKLDYLSQEFRLSSPEGRPLTWLVGAFYYDEDGEGITSGVIQRAGTAVVAAPMRAKSGSHTRNVAPFGRVQYAFGALRVSLEGRWNKETVQVLPTQLAVTLNASGQCAVVGQPCVFAASKTFTDFAPRLTVDFKPGKDSLLYVQAATGSKSGGFNTTAGIPLDRFAFDGESIKSLEVGYKQTFLGGRAGLSAALFRNDIRDLQLSNLIVITSPFVAPGAPGSTTTTTIVNNVGKARTQGLELDLSARLAPWLTMNLNYAYTDAKAVQGTETVNGTAFGGNTSVAGFSLPRTPEHSAAASLALDTPLGGSASGLRVFGRVDAIHQSRRYAEIQNMIWADPFTKVNLSGGLRGKDWRVTLWVKNATNETSSNNGFRYLDPATFRRSAVDFLPRLRQAGLTVNYDF